jgi:hypothetical protein
MSIIRDANLGEWHRETRQAFMDKKIKNVFSQLTSSLSEDSYEIADDRAQSRLRRIARKQLSAAEHDQRRLARFVRAPTIQPGLGRVEV